MTEERVEVHEWTLSGGDFRCKKCGLVIVNDGSGVPSEHFQPTLMLKGKWTAVDCLRYSIFRMMEE